MSKSLGCRRSRLLMGAASAALIAAATTNPAQAILTQDTIDPNSVLDTANVYSNVGALLVLNPDTEPGFVGICTGTLVNPRTVLTATHCVRNSGGTEVYTAGGPYTVRFRNDPDALMASDFASDVIVPNGANAAEFPDLDFTIVALSKPIGGIDYAPVLLSPLTRDTVATIVGYGTVGQGSNPDEAFDLRRRVTQNVVQYLGSISNFVDDTFGAGQGAGESTQMLYWSDFDRVGRQAFFDDPTGIDYDPLPGDALNSSDPKQVEGNTGPGDSGGPLFAHIKNKQYLAGVLSGGETIFGDGNGNGLFGYYGTETYWNPIYKYANFLIANNPYKYVHALRGDGDWTDPKHWEQLLDPGYVILDSKGNPKNGIPTSTPSDASAKFGRFRDINDVIDGGDGLPDAAFHDDKGVVPTSGVLGGSGSERNNGHGPSGPSSRPDTLKGPGSRNFVPNNTDGTPGTEFANPAQYFDVTLDGNGTTRLKNAAITIDHLTLADPSAGLDIRPGAALAVNLETEIEYGDLNVDGTLTARTVINTIGVLEGSGHVKVTNGVVNLAGLVSPGGRDVGTLTVDGNFTQANYGTVFFQIGKTTTDLLQVNGAAAIDGNLLVDSDRRLKFGDRFVVVRANSVTGNFDNAFGSGTLLFGRTVADADSVDLVIDAKKLTDLFGLGDRWHSVAVALDYARGNHFQEMSGLFDLVDGVPLDALHSLVPSLTPLSAMEQMPLAISYSQTFTRDLAGRTAELRAGQRGISEQSLLNGYRMLQGNGDQTQRSDGFTTGPATQIDTGQRFGFFVSGDGNVTEVGHEAYQGDHYDPTSLAFTSQANMTVGMDYRMSDHFALGIATTMTRYQTHDGARTPLDHTGYGAMMYSSLWDGDAFLDSYAGMARQDFDMSRLLVDGSSLTQALSSHPEATQALAGARAGWMFHPAKGLSLGPTLSVNYSRLNFGAYDESGGGAFDLSIDGRSMTSMTAEAGMQFAWQPAPAPGSRSQFAAYGRVALVSELGDGADRVSAHFAASPDVSFDLTNPVDRQWASVGAGMSYQFGSNMTATIEGNADIGRGDLSANTVTAGFTYSF